MRNLCCLIVLLCLYCKAGAQQNNGLAIGQTLPELSISKIMNNADVVSSTGHYRGKLLLLNFMATSCGGCVKSLPALEGLQKQFSSQLQVLLVTVERSDRIKAFLRRNSGFTLPFVTEDSLLSSFFPHKYLSHVVWVDGAGVVRAITPSEYVTAKNILTILNGEQVHWPVKKDFTSFDFNQSILSTNENNIPQDMLPLKRVYTAVTNNLPGVQKHIGVQPDSINAGIRYSYINYSICQLYLLMYNCYNLPKSHIVLDVKDKQRFIHDAAFEPMEEWKRKNTYCLEAVFADGFDSAALKQKLLGDIDFYFGTTGKMEMQLTNCLILQNKTAAMPVSNNQSTGMRVGMLEYLLNDSVGAVPVINETTGNVFTRLPLAADMIKDDAYLRKVLDNYGLELVKGQRWVKRLILTQPVPAATVIF